MEAKKNPTYLRALIEAVKGFKAAFEHFLTFHVVNGEGGLGVARGIAPAVFPILTRLRAARLDNTLEAEFRRLARLDLLIVDDFALRPLDATTTADFYELVVERHKKAATIFTSNRDAAEWLTMTTDPMLAQSAIDRLTGSAHTLIIEGPSYRQRPPTDHRGIDRTKR